MPGRQFTAPKVQRRTKRNPQKRSLNALAIATNSNPDDLKVRRHRLGEADARSKAGKQVAAGRGGGYSSNLESQMDSSRNGKIGLDVDGGSDSEGNRWRLGQVGSDEDSDIDSDEAMGESDEDRFEGFTFRGSTSRKHTSGLKESKVQLRGEDAGINLEEQEESSGNESDRTDGSLGEGAIDLAAMLDASAEVEHLSKKRRISSDEGDAGVHSGTAAEESGPGDGGDDGSILSMSGDEEAVDPAKLSALQNLISSLESSVQDPATKRQRVSEVNESRAPFEFGIGSSKKLTVADLLPSVANHSLRKPLKIIAASDIKSSSSRTGIPSKLEVPLAKRQQDRLDRDAAYEKSKETLNRWIDTVKHNRRTEHLSFPLPDPSGEAACGTRLLPIASSEPLNELESAIQTILQDSGLVMPNGKTDEGKIRLFEELQTNKMPLAEVEARRTQLRMAREFLFREEVRAKRIKKIKSKSYRRIRRKQREKAESGARGALALAGVRTSDDEEHNDRRRAEERMGARHRESKWAKAMKGSGRGAWDEDTRTGIVEMARRGEELRRRINGKPVGDANGHSELSDDETSDSDVHSEDSGEVGSGGERETRKLLSQLSKVGHSPHPRDQWLGGDSRLSSLKFMQKAEAARKAENDAAAVNLRRELAGEDSSSDEDLLSLVGRKKYGLNKPTKGACANGFSSNKSGDGSPERDSVAGIGLDVDVGIEGPLETQGVGRWLAHPRVIPRDGGSKATTVPKALTNPWMGQDEVLSQRRRQRDEVVDRKRSMGGKISSEIKASRAAAGLRDEKSDAVIIDPNLVLKTSKPTQARRNLTATSSNAFHTTDSWKPVAMAPEMADNNSEDEDPNIPVSITDHELVRRAFAGDDVVEEFEMEKKKTICDEEEKVIDNSLPGWGSWTGAGVSKKEEKRNKGKILSKKEGIKEDKRRDAKLDRVIVNEKRVKKNVKYLASNLPHPFENREQYERSLRLPVGPEWTTKDTFQNATKPRIMVKQGRVIDPMCNPFM